MDTLLFLAAIGGYLIGSISFTRVIKNVANPKIDLDKARMHISKSGESGTVSGIGASTASAALGKKYGGIVSALDMFKAFIPVLLLRILFPEQIYYLVFSILCILGHNYPLYYRFQGGRGLSPMLGSLLVIEPIGLVVCMLLGTLIAILINQPFTALIIWFPLLAAWGWFVNGSLALAFYALALLVIYIIAGIPEIRLALQYFKQGRFAEYSQIILDSGPQTRAMQRLSARVRFWERKEPPLA